MTFIQKIYFFLLRNIPRKYQITASYYFSRLFTFMYRGNKVECPVCGGKFRKFLPYGVWKKRDNVLCPNCFSLERHRLMWLFLRNQTRFFTDIQKVLHIAPEQCFRDRFRKMKNINYLTGDLDSPISDVNFDVQAMPFKDNEFDVVICNHVLEHVEDDRKAISEIYRVLKKGGYAILFVPMDFSKKETLEDPSIVTPAERQKHYRQKDHLRLYGMDYLDRLKEAGFKITAKNYNDIVDLNDKKRYSLPDNELMYAYFK